MCPRRTPWGSWAQPLGVLRLGLGLRSRGRQPSHRISAPRESKARPSWGVPSPESCWWRFQDSRLPSSWPFSTPWCFLDSVSLLKLPTPLSLPCLPLLTPTKDWNWLSALGLATVIAAFVNKLRIYRNPLFPVSPFGTWEQSNGSAGNP